ncbi:ArsR family transcriptional regulator [Candidatus Bathyarchaeota archaeon]|nr:MAG: ArsR family transcriptional regulator [Candidatus Bathyarchaeota archaeon]
MSKLEVIRALSSEVRLEILKLVYQKPRDIEDLARNHLKLQPITIRHHIQIMHEAGLVESYEERKGTAGRPKTYYRIAEKLPMINFPSRRYFDLSKAILNHVGLKIGEKKTMEILADVGNELGKETADYLTMTNDVKQWTMKDFAEIFIEKYLVEAGAEPEIIKKSNSRVKYRTHNCLFFELAQKTPNLMCDVLHNNFHSTLLKTMSNNFKDSQTSCMGHGSACCEHTVEWIPEKNKTNISK